MINWTLCISWHFGLEKAFFKDQHEYKKIALTPLYVCLTNCDDFFTFRRNFWIFTQLQSATVYFICMISFLHSHSLTRLGHKYWLTIPFMSHDQIRVKGHVGVTGVKKVIFTKNTTLPTDLVAWSRDLCMW